MTSGRHGGLEDDSDAVDNDHDVTVAASAANDVNDDYGFVVGVVLVVTVNPVVDFVKAE